jgi:hypothetical protein
MRYERIIMNDYISRHCYGIYVVELTPTKENQSK